MEEKKLLRPDVEKLLEEWAEWSGDKEIEAFANEAVLKRLQSLAEDLAGYGIPRAREFAVRAEELLREMGAEV